MSNDGARDVASFPITVGKSGAFALLGMDLSGLGVADFANAWRSCSQIQQIFKPTVHFVGIFYSDDLEFLF